ncbi:MAG: endonuclease/exonuclease/phosphatase family protein [Bdellovibrionaceae bacterium]|nr:endonuclease/exonuclease/phosphatase family protein [Bdellovibrionales bacterium]MCB9084247.1 endonuclease/exonuclease/phosphatase family protein [Pseudobdellovibrionaceae bacterium]
MGNDKRLRLLTYNMHKGFCFYSRRQVLEEIKRAIREVNADLVFLQEIRGESSVLNQNGVVNGEFASQLEFLADSVWDHYAYGKNAIYQTTNHGNAILSRFPVKKWSNIDISTNPFERRGLLHSTVLHPECGELDLICLHLNLLARGRRWQLERLVGKLAAEVESGPIIIAGDFNDWSQAVSGQIGGDLKVKEAHHSLHGRYARTFPSLMPLLCLDRVYYRDLTPTLSQVLSGRPWSQMSDHAPLLVEFALNP